MRFGRLGAGALSFCVSLVLATGCSQSSPRPESDESPVGSTAQAVQGGADDGTDHPFAVGVCSGGKNDCQGFCSGTLITPNLVVTARHCVDNTSKIIDCTTNPVFGARHTSMWITTSNKMIQNPNTGWHQVKSVVTPPDNHVCGNDIALLVLVDQVAGAEATPAIPGVQYPMNDLNKYVRRFTAVAYGNTSPQGFTAGTRRIRAGIGVLCIPGDDVAPCPATINDKEFVGGDGICEGDSGSSAFEDRTFAKGAPVSFGVLSRGGESDDGLTCKGSLYTRLDKWRDLVVNAATAASNNWTLYPKPFPDWTVYIPPPPAKATPDAGSKKPTDLGDGIACADNSECKSKVCADTGAGLACTVACDESVVPTECQAGFVCKASVCVQDLGEDPAPAASAAPTTTTTTGCSAAPRSGAPSSPLGTLGLAAAAVLAFGARRRARIRA